MALTLELVGAAARRLSAVAIRTPVLESSALNGHSGMSLYLKSECFQRSGSFKFRGAYNAVASLPAVDRARGVCTVSSGNHAQALGLAAELHGIPAAVLMPADAPEFKRRRVGQRGVEIINFDRYTDDRYSLVNELAARRGMNLVHPYDDYKVMAGQGTVAMELLDDVADLDALVVCLGGGGLLAGCACVVKALRPSIKVIGVEPELADDTMRSLQTGKRIRINVGRTIADGLQTPIPGELTFPVVQRFIDDVVTVSDEEILRAMHLLYESLNIVAEPSGAVALAAALAGRLSGLEGRKVAIAITGANIDHGHFHTLLSRTSSGAGRDAGASSGVSA